MAYSSTLFQHDEGHGIVVETLVVMFNVNKKCVGIGEITTIIILHPFGDGNCLLSAWFVLVQMLLFIVRPCSIANSLASVR